MHMHTLDYLALYTKNSVQTALYTKNSVQKLKCGLSPECVHMFTMLEDPHWREPVRESQRERALQLSRFVH